MVNRIKQGIRKYDAVVNVIKTDDRKIIQKYGLSRGCLHKWCAHCKKDGTMERS